MLLQLRTLLLSLIPLLIFTLASLSVLHEFQLAVYTWIKGASWLPSVCIFIAITISAVFGRSRLALAGMAWIAFYHLGSQIPSELIAPQQSFLAMTVLLFTLLWFKDKGSQPLALLLSLLSLLACTALGFLALTWLEQQQIFTPFYQWMYQLSPSLNQHYSPMQFVAFSLLPLIGMVRLQLTPTLSNMLLFCQLISLSLLHYWQQWSMIELSMLPLALMTVVCVIFESYSMAFRDELTGIPSRRAMQQYVQTLGSKYVVVMSDIDFFKKFNDTYGHDVGDQVLKLVASRLNKVKGGGRAFRYGGEEFTLIFARKTIEQVMPHVEAIRAEIEAYKMVLRDKNRPEKGKQQRNNSNKQNANTVSVTCSFGVAAKSRELSDFQDVMKQADIALYAAKEAGRNCVKS